MPPVFLSPCCLSFRAFCLPLVCSMALACNAPAWAAASQITCPGPQSRFPHYDREARAAFWHVYRAGGATLYCGAAFGAGERRTSPSALPINIEHVVPQSLLKRIRGAGADLHNMWPAMEEVNSARQNWRLVPDIAGDKLFFSARREPELAQCDFEVQETGNGAVVEPAPAARGRLARATLHMYVAYRALHIDAADIGQMLAWHVMDPVSAEERRRNDEIEALTGVRNAFVDLPEQASAIVSQCRAARKGGLRARPRKAQASSLPRPHLRDPKNA